MRAVHVGAGNIGRGFIGLLLAEAGFHVVFADVQAELISRLQEADAFTVHEVGEGGRDHVITDFSAVNSAAEEDRLVAEISQADVYTTAVGPRVLPFLVSALLAGLRARTSAVPLVVMACENAIGATSQLRDALIDAAGEDWHDLSARAVFADTAVDRIVPGQADAGLDVTVEAFSEWVIEAPPLGAHRPDIPGATFVDDLAPFIERKLFTVNTGHAATAYLGARSGRETIAEAIADPTIRAAVEQALEETSALIVAEHGVAVDEQDAYRAKILGRFTNPHLPDTVSRVGREPLRKLGRHERFIGPAARLAELGLPTAGLLSAVEAALEFSDPGDEQSGELQRMLTELSPEDFTAQVTGLQPDEPLYPEVRSLVAAQQRKR